MLDILVFRIIKLSFFQNILNNFFGKNEENKGQDKGILEYGDQLKNTDLDYKFAQLFTLSGGIFNYCADEAEALGILNKIIKIDYSSVLTPQNDAAFITCEYLIAYDGRIMLSYNNILHFNSLKLPEKIIVMASVSQIVSNLSEAMAKIQRRESVKNLTSVSGSKSQLDNPDKKNPKLFLLLLED